MVVGVMMLIIIVCRLRVIVVYVCYGYYEYYGYYVYDDNVIMNYYCTCVSIFYILYHLTLPTSFH